MNKILREKHDGALGDRSSVRVWLRLLSCTMLIEKEIRRRFAALDMTLPRFDILAALDRHREMTMGQLSRALLVSNGNVTQLVQALVRDGLIEMERRPADRRTAIVRMTAEGTQRFEALALAHQSWIEELVGGMDYQNRERLYSTLGSLKTSIGRARDKEAQK